MTIVKTKKALRSAIDGKTYVKNILLLMAATLAYAPTARADELSDIQAQAKQLRDHTAAMNKQMRQQSAAITKRLADLEKRQKTLEAQKPVAINPIDAMAADLPYKAAKVKAPESDDICVHGICLYGNFDMGLMYQNHAAPFNAFDVGPLSTVVEKPSNGSYFGVGANMMSTSFIGLRGKQEIADNLYAVFNLQTLFNPASGMNANQVGVLRRTMDWEPTCKLFNLPTRSAICRKRARCSTMPPISVLVHLPTAPSRWVARAH